MYWPLGIPNYYSASRQSAAPAAIETDDGADKSEKSQSRSNGTAQDAGQDTSLPQFQAAADEQIRDIKASRGGQIFATITRRTLSIWQTKPTVLLATAVRSQQSLGAYGDNCALLMRPDALILVVQATGGYLITYSLASDPNAQVYQLSIRNWASNSRRQSGDAIRRSSNPAPDYGPGDGSGIRDVSIRFRMVIRIDAGICCAIALDEEIMVATTKPAAIQCIRWSPDKSGSSHNTDLLKRMSWFVGKSASVTDLVFDRPMGLHVWVSSDGRAYAVQRGRPRRKSDQNAESAYKGYCFHEPETEGEYATHVAVNARFSLVAVGCADASIRVYTAKDYLGNIPLSHALMPPVSREDTGALTFVLHSPDGYCIFAGFEHGWATWSVYGKPGATSFASEQRSPPDPQHWWLGGVAAGFFSGAGAELMLLSADRLQIAALDMARASVAGCFDMANIHRAMLQTSSGLLLHRPSDAATGGDATWLTLRFPATYLARHWPVRCTVISADGKYIAIAGRRGLAHYSTASGRWKTFDDPTAEDDFTVRGGMCWFQHILVAAVESEGQSQIRLYSREKHLSASSAVYTEAMQYPVIHMALQDANSLLVYTHENVLLHYVFDASPSSVRLVQVGQIGFHGIIRAPARVRSISWIVPDEQRENGDPSQDVAKAAVLFLIDGKLVLLQPSPEEHRELKYDMRVIAHDVEFYLLAREGRTRAPHPLAALGGDDEAALTTPLGSSLHDSLWYFNGTSMHCWPDVHELVSSISSELNQQTLPAVEIPTDFYPLTPLIDQGTLSGLEPDLVQRRDADLSFFRATARSHLFIPRLLRHYLSRFDSPAALHLSDSYKELPYFPHALEVLLHDVLDDEVDAQASASGDEPDRPVESQLASLLPFLSSFPSYLDIVLGCARKNELRSWRTLFQHLPPVAELFEQALKERRLKTAGGFLLVLHTFDEERFTAEMIARLLVEAKKENDWDLCKELARFLVGVDASGELLRRSLEGAGMLPADRKVNGLQAE